MTFKKIMMRRMLRREEREDWRRKGGLQRQRGRAIADEREGEKWLIFALTDASGICVTMLPHLSSLSDITACAIKGRERQIHAYRDGEFHKKEGRKRATDWETDTYRQKRMELLERAGTWRKSPSPRCWWMSKSWRQMRAMLQGKRRGRGDTERGNRVRTCRRKARHDKVLNRMSPIARCAWLQPALSPCVLVREESRNEKAQCMNVGTIDGRGRRGVGRKEGKCVFWHG